MVLRAPYNADKLPDWVLGALPYGYCIPKFAATVHHWFCKEQVSMYGVKSVNLIAEKWNHKTVSWVGSIATQKSDGTTNNRAR